MSFHPEYKERHTKAGRNKKETECSVIRRNDTTGCGICGSKNTAEQGVKYCNVCGKEVDFLSLQDEWFSRRDVDVKCNCVVKWKTSTISVGKCLDCGSVQSNYCPNCNIRYCWNDGFGNLYCQRCGFKNYIG